MTKLVKKKFLLSEITSFKLFSNFLFSHYFILQNYLKDLTSYGKKNYQNLTVKIYSRL